MDEYRGRYEAYGRREQQQQEYQQQHQHHESPPEPSCGPGPPRGILESFGIGGDWLDDYLPILLILLGLLGLYLLLGKQNEGLGGLLGSFLR